VVFVAEGIPMNDYEALQVTAQVVQFRSGPEYRRACQSARHRTSADLANAAENSEDYAAIRLVISTWDQIAILTKGFSATQKHDFFKTQPITLVWNALQPAVSVIRDAKGLGPTFAKDFQDLYDEYYNWATTEPEGQSYHSSHHPAVHAMFDVAPPI
jgi:hypothetical protein